MSKSVTVGNVEVLVLFECRRGEQYMTANRNFVCFAHSYINPPEKKNRRTFYCLLKGAFTRDRTIRSQTI